MTYTDRDRRPSPTVTDHKNRVLEFRVLRWVGKTRSFNHSCKVDFMIIAVRAKELMFCSLTISSEWHFWNIFKVWTFSLFFEFTNKKVNGWKLSSKGVHFRVLFFELLKIISLHLFRDSGDELTMDMLAATLQTTMIMKFSVFICLN